MLSKLERMGFRGSMKCWFDSYLSDRRMVVQIGDKKSHTKILNIGLPQGAVTSPYLFSYYVNDMHNASDKLQFIHFADDTTVYMSGNNLQTLCTDVSNELNKIWEWLKANRLSLNIDKTWFMLFTHSNVTNIPFSVDIGGNVLERVTSTKFLGIYIDERLSFNTHILHLSRKLAHVNEIMRKIAHFMPLIVLRGVYFSLFQSILEYGMSVWGVCGVTNCSRISNIQCRVMKLLANLSNGVSPPLPYEKLYILRILCQFCKFYKSNDPNNYFYGKIMSLLQGHTHGTRFRIDGNLNLPHMNKSVTQKQFLYNAVIEWNTIATNMYKKFSGQ